MKKVGLITHKIYLNHDTGSKHPERSSRIKVVFNNLEKYKILFDCIKINPYKSPLKWIEKVHEKNYINQIKHASIFTKNYFLYNSDCVISPLTYEVSLWASGGVLAAIDQVMNHKINRAFCLIRPPGHHAEYNCAKGFCFFNHVAIAANYLKEKYEIEKIFILDWDVHHGNGTQNIFENDPNVFYCSLHEDPRFSYPGSGFLEEIGKGKAKGFTLNCPLPQGIENKEYLKIFDEKVIPAIEKFKPNFILISAGFDAHKKDPLSKINLTEEVYAIMTTKIVKLSNIFCSGRIISVLEGGYHLSALSLSIEKHINQLLEK